MSGGESLWIFNRNNIIKFLHVFGRWSPNNRTYRSQCLTEYWMMCEKDQLMMQWMNSYWYLFSVFGILLIMDSWLLCCIGFHQAVI